MFMLRPRGDDELQRLGVDVRTLWGTIPTKLFMPNTNAQHSPCSTLAIWKLDEKIVNNY